MENSYKELKTYNGVNLMLSLNNSEISKDYETIAWPSDDDTVNNYEDDSIKINRISLNNPTDGDFCGKMLMLYSSTLEDKIWNYANNTGLKYGTYYIQVLQRSDNDENNLQYISLKLLNVNDIDNKINIKKNNYFVKKDLNKNVVWKCIGYKALESENTDLETELETASDFIIKSIPFFDSTSVENYTVKYTTMENEDSTTCKMSVTITLNDSNDEIIFDFEIKYLDDNDIIIETNNTDSAVISNDDENVVIKNLMYKKGKFVYRITNVKFNNNDYTEPIYETLNELPLNDKYYLKLDTTKIDSNYTFCNEYIRISISDYKFNCIPNKCQILFSETTYCALPHQDKDDPQTKKTITFNPYELLRVSLNNSNKDGIDEGISENENIKPLFYFYNFCDFWNNYYSYCPIDKLIFLKQGNYQFKCYNDDNKEIPGSINLLPCDSNLTLHDNNIIVGTNSSINLNLYTFDRSKNLLWLNKENKVELLKENKNILETQYTLWLKNGIPKNLQESLGYELSLNLISIYNKIDSQGIISDDTCRNYSLDWEKAHIINNPDNPDNPSEEIKADWDTIPKPLSFYIWKNGDDYFIDSNKINNEIELEDIYPNDFNIFFYGDSVNNEELSKINVILVFKNDEFLYNLYIDNAVTCEINTSEIDDIIQNKKTSYNSTISFTIKSYYGETKTIDVNAKIEYYLMNSYEETCKVTFGNFEIDKYWFTKNTNSISIFNNIARTSLSDQTEGLYLYFSNFKGENNNYTSELITINENKYQCTVTIDENNTYNTEIIKYDSDMNILMKMQILDLVFNNSSGTYTKLSCNADYLYYTETSLDQKPTGYVNYKINLDSSGILNVEITNVGDANYDFDYKRLKLNYEFVIQTNIQDITYFVGPQFMQLKDEFAIFVYMQYLSLDSIDYVLDRDNIEAVCFDFFIIPWNDDILNEYNSCNLNHDKISKFLSDNYVTKINIIVPNMQYVNNYYVALYNHRSGSEKLEIYYKTELFNMYKINNSKYKISFPYIEMFSEYVPESFEVENEILINSFTINNLLSHLLTAKNELLTLIDLNIITITDGYYYTLVKELNSDINILDDWIGQIYFVPDDPDDFNSNLTLSIIFLNEIDSNTNIEYYNAKNELVQCNSVKNFYLGSKDYNLKTFIENGINFNFSAIYKSPYYIENSTIELKSYLLYPSICKFVTEPEDSDKFKEIVLDKNRLEDYNLTLYNNKLYFKYAGGICLLEVWGRNTEILSSVYTFQNGNYVNTSSYVWEANSERNIGISEQPNTNLPKPNIPFIPTFLYRSGEDGGAYTSATANNLSISIIYKPGSFNVSLNTSLGTIIDSKIYPGSLWNRSIDDWIGKYVGALSNIFKAEMLKSVRTYITNYAYYKKHNTSFIKDVLITISPRSISNCNKYLTIRDFNYVDWLNELKQYRLNNLNKDSNINILLEGVTKNFPTKFDFDYKISTIDTSVPVEADTAIVLLTVDENKLHNIISTKTKDIDEKALYTLDGNNDPVKIESNPYVPNCNNSSFVIEKNSESNDMKIYYTGNLNTKLSISDLVSPNKLKLNNEGELQLVLSHNSGYYDVCTTYRTNWRFKKFQEYLTGLPLNNDFFE